MRIVQSCFLLVVLVVLEACSLHAPPRYQALEGSSFSLYPGWQGYFDYQIDEQTYLIGYSNYLTAATGIYKGDWLSWKWLKGAQEHTLYRASELTRGKGKSFFVVLHKDDWSLMYQAKRRVSPPRPGALAIIRILDADAGPLGKHDNRVYRAEALCKRSLKKIAD